MKAPMRKRFMHWLWDGWPCEWKPLWFVRVASRLACLLAGHEPTCNLHHRPERDHCAWCGKRMPFRAHPGYTEMRETP